MKNRIIQFRESEFHQHTGLLKGKLFPIVEAMAMQYTKLNIGPFNQEAYEDIVFRSIARTKGKYEKLVQDDLKQFKSNAVAAAVLGAITESLQPLQQIRQELHETLRKLTSNSLTANLSFDDFEIVSGKPVVKEQQIKRQYETVIDSEEKEQLFTKMQAVKSAWNDLNEYVNSVGYNTRQYPFVGFGGFLSIGESGVIDLNLESVNSIDSAKQLEEIENS
jgi:hypothetical protein